MSSNEQKPSVMDKWLPIGLFVACAAAIVAATLYFEPSWGLMDDKAFRDRAIAYWENPSDTGIVTGEFNAAGMFRPVVFVWATVFYKVFEHWPTGFYIFIAAGNMASMLLWGLIFYRFFNVRRQDLYWSAYFFPLAFFVFTPFWNLFSYLSLQEKFVVFFAPLAFYFFQNTYEQGRPRDWIVLYFILILGMLSKATFIFVPAAMAVYALLDLVFFSGRRSVSWAHLLITVFSLSFYTFFTVTVQLKSDYTSKYKSGMTIAGMIGKVLASGVLSKVLILVGVTGFLICLFRAIRNKNRTYLLAGMIYCGLVVYLMVLLPWGLYSYLLSAVGPLALGAFFPAYAWIIRKGGFWKVGINALIVLTVCFVFVGNNIPSISRMADMGKAIAFLRYKEGSSEDVYFMPSGYPETTQTAEKFTGKRVYYCGDGKITDELLRHGGKNYLILMDLLPSIEFSGVKIGPRVYANGTWQIFEVMADRGTKERFSVEFQKTLLQRLKTKIRDM